MPAHDLRRERAHLVALQLPEEVPARRQVGALGRLGQQLLRAVLAEVDDAGLRRTARTRSTSTVLVAATRVTSAASRPARRAAAAIRDANRRDRGGGRWAHVGSRGARHHHDGLAPGRAVAPVGEVVGRRRGAHADVDDVGDPGARAAPLRTAAGMSSAGVPHVGGGRRRRAEARRPGASGGRHRTRSAPGGCTARAPRARSRRRRHDRLRQRARPPRSITPALESGPAGVHHRRRASAPTSAIGAQSAVSTTSGRPTAVGDRGVGHRSAPRSARAGRRRATGRPRTLVAVHLPEPHPCARVRRAQRRARRRGGAGSRPRRRGRRRRGRRGWPRRTARVGHAAVPVGERPRGPTVRSITAQCGRAGPSASVSGGTRGRRTRRRRRRSPPDPTGSRSRCRRRRGRVVVVEPERREIATGAARLRIGRSRRR